MTREAINELKKYTLGRKNTEKVEISVLQLNRVIKALEQEPCDVFDEYGNYKYRVMLTEPNTATSMPCEDAISRQAVIDAMYALCNTGETLKENPWRDNPHIDAITDAIEDLPLVHSQPNKEDIHREREQAYMRGYEDGSRKYRTEQSEDAISRSDMLDVIGHGTTYTSEDLQKIIKGMPPVNPQEPKTGHWIFDEILDKHYYCSECKSMGVDYWDFCPYCGAKMIEPQESEGIDADSN